jgi:hypothetical protein
MLVSNNTIFSSTLAADGAWRNISNFLQFSVQVTGVEGTVWIEVSNDPNVMTDGASSLAAPSAPTLSQVAYGAQSGQGTYFVKTTYATAAGETLGSSESSLAVSDGNMLVIASPGASGAAIGWNAYVSKATGKEVQQNLNYGLIPIGQSFSMPSFYPGGASLPTSNTTGSVSLGINISGNLATFTAPTGVAEIQFAYDNTNKMAVMNPSSIVWNFIRVRKSATAQTLLTQAFLFGQQG